MRRFLLPVHGVILNPRVFAVRFTLHAASCVGAALHLFLMMYPMLLDCLRSCFGQYKVIASESFKDLCGGDFEGEGLT